ncbi:MAG: hypothetical protein COB53_10545 [Elusimicrobia bacterium]|nr:MAG: hypothetical protein COB53_10545 [Elusimicrobiota bacterium]
MIRLALAVLFIASGTHAQKLDEFTESLKSGKGKPLSTVSSASSKTSFDLSSDRWDSCDTLALCILQLTIELGTVPTLEYTEFRPQGHPTIPIIRVDGGYQRIVGNIDAFSFRGEMGYSLIALAVEYMEFREANQQDRLTSTYWEALYRTAPSPHFRLDWAIGYRLFTREENFGGVQTGASLGIYPAKTWGLEVDGRWGSINEQVLSDYRGRLIIAIPSWKAFAIRGGYRAVRAGNVTLHGPEFGITLVY